MSENERPRNNPLVRTTTSESLEIHFFKDFMVFKVVTLGVAVRKQKISSFNMFQEHGHTLSWENC